MFATDVLLVSDDDVQVNQTLLILRHQNPIVPLACCT